MNDSTTTDTRPSEATAELLRQLIAFDTTSRNSNLALIDFVQNYLNGFGVDSDLVHNPERSKANLFATIGPTDVPGICLSGHTDVVPVDNQDWRSDPFTLTERDNLWYGRGVADMKGFLAVCLALLPEMTNAELSTPLHLAFSYDEEIGCIGVRTLLTELAKRAVKPRGCIIGEPTSMQVIRGHKGKLSVDCTVRGRTAHSSLTDQGVNAVEAAAEAVAKLKHMARRHRDDGPHDSGFQPPYTTIHTGVMSGGTALNIVPAECQFVFEFRHLPEDNPEALLRELQAYVDAEIQPEMHAVDPNSGFRWSIKSRIPGLNTDEDADIVSLARSLTGRNDTGMVSFGTEAGLFQEIDIPSVVCGPGSIEQAHKADEFIDPQQLAQCEDFIRALVQRCSNSEA